MGLHEFGLNGYSAFEGARHAMHEGVTLATDRLILRRWRADDRGPFARINADVRVMEFYPAVLTRAESDSMIERAEAYFRKHGFGPWAVALRATGEFIGYVGLVAPRFEAHFTPCIEIGWRLAAEHWGSGLATEGARAALLFGFETVGLNEIVSFTTPANVRSLRVMQKLGMERDQADDFDHPNLPEGHPLRRHVLYRLRAPEPV
jgi:ribosomal-protein-alanine N-acetyltransferase